jgi:electron transfer flavoprotein alpha subunit
MEKLSNVWVFSDSESRLGEIIAGALSLSENVSVLVLGDSASVQQAFSFGAGKVINLGEKTPERLTEDYADTIAQVIAGADKPALILLPATRRCKALAAKLGAKLKAGVLNDASGIVIEDGAVRVKHMVYGGLAISEEKIISPIAIVTVAGGVFAPNVADESRTGETVKTEFVAPSAAIRRLNTHVKPGESVDLSKARIVVSVGRGIGSKDNIAQAQALCAAIGAELGCSRPIAENEHWMDRERYIGISGIMIKPDVYLALGVSGQIQHMVGVSDAQTIVVVNKDKNAPIFQYADYGIVGDLFKVLPVLTQALHK